MKGKYVSVYLSVTYLFFWLSVCLSDCLSVRLTVCECTYVLLSRLEANSLPLSPTTPPTRRFDVSATISDWNALSTDESELASQVSVCVCMCVCIPLTRTVPHANHHTNNDLQ